MPDDVTALFEEELGRRGVSFSPDDEPGCYKVQHGGSKLFVSLSNLTRKYGRDPDNAHVANFVDTVLGARFDALPWEQVRASVLFCLEPTDYTEPPDFHTAISGRVDRVPVHLDASQAAITWITPWMLKDWKVTIEAVEAAALDNLAAALARATVEHKNIDGVELGHFTTELPFKTALILAPNLKEIVSPTLGWPLHAVMPDRDFVYLWAAKHETFFNRVGRVVVKEFTTAPYPLTTELFEIGDGGIAAIGAFPVETA